MKFSESVTRLDKLHMNMCSYDVDIENHPVYNQDINMNKCSYVHNMEERRMIYDEPDDIESTETRVIPEEIMEHLKSGQPDENMLFDLAELFKIFGDSTRIRIMSALFETEMCVCDIAELLKMTQSAISHQLRILRQSKLVKTRKDGKTVFYSLADEHVMQIFDQGLSHISEK